ncbi:hypothetical protein BD626DRAFT_485779 [Schizophyllum amplum]|uniref:Carbohydrate-binding module family 1 protein n=1 Tax=Schizophyllum amplum TaxID=97359 RepID=A0A550CLZ2_9AGAR|nr:hypothetical protein BD626DRAFT_485779 [Auriculariopsis ampla]
MATTPSWLCVVLCYSSKMWSTLLVFALAAPQFAQALLRFPCAQTTVVRSDPLVNPDSVGAHLHQVVGGASFDFNMPTGYDLQAQSTCSSCSIVENKSNYWTPTLYFQSPSNGTLTRVKQRPGPITGSPNGGMVVYYNQIGNVTAFPKGFRMVAGDPMIRSYNASYDDSRSITFRCLQANDASGTGQDTNGMPTQACAGGVRSQINFPTCWDGKNVDSANHRDHVSYAINASFGNFGNGCPSTHPVTIPLLFLETYWDTTPFNNEPGAFSNGKQPFVWSMGDPTGYGYHADYMMGWPEDVLKQAMAQCTDASGQISSCPVLTSRSEQDMNDCAVPPRVEEVFDGWLEELPGCNPIVSGPGPATPTSGCGAPTTTQSADEVSFLKTGIDGWEPVGCAAEPSGSTLLTGGTTTGGGMTIEKCLDSCASNSMQFAGLKAGNICSCGASLDTSKVSQNYACNIVCEADGSEFCGAANRVAVYNSGTAVSVPPSSPTSPTGSATTGPAAPTGGSATIPQYGQCGGQGWTGNTVCAAGMTCTALNSYYSQCL